MRTRQRSTLTAFDLFSILGGGALAQSESIPRREAEDLLDVRNWTVDFSPAARGEGRGEGAIAEEQMRKSP